MSTLSRAVKTQREVLETKKVVNYMGGTSYEVNPIDSLKLVAASSIFGEPTYYRRGEFARKGVNDGIYTVRATQPDSLILTDKFRNKTTSEVMEELIDEALTYNFEETLNLALELRNNMYMRLNPQVIMVRAALHPARVEFNKNNPGVFKNIENAVMRRADEPATQLAYYLYSNGGKKNGIPSILKRSWASKIEKLTPYQIYKYKNSGIGLIDTIRICHPSSEKNPAIKELVETGNIALEESNSTWENLRANGKTWLEILTTIKVPHMALLRNLRGIFTEINNKEAAIQILESLLDGVKGGMQFPFRYSSAMEAVVNSTCNHKDLIVQYLEKCIDIAVFNMPKLKGKTMCLSDNSGSAHGTFNSEYGSVTVAKIGNLSSVITAQLSDEGYVGLFGDRLDIHKISPDAPILRKAKELNSVGREVGMSTENGIWLFFKQALENKEHWDNIFVYSDMQAGHGGLYGINSNEYKDFSCRGIFGGSRYIDVMKLVKEYKKQVNPNVNVFMVQTGGYNNVLIPENFHRGSILTGWTGKEVVYADSIIKTWDSIEEKNSVKA